MTMTTTEVFDLRYHNLYLFFLSSLWPALTSFTISSHFSTESQLIFQHLTASQPTSAICFYLQTEEQATETDTILNLFCEMINEAAFHKLRTEEQLSESRG